jgi:predicted enzyme related to lactoylglutathione lyase
MHDNAPGHIRWIDLTVKEAPRLREFYEAVVGWKSDPVNTGHYEDWNLTPEGAGEEPVAGVCHARGSNEGLPPVWLIYITVADLAESMENCKELGGKVVFGPKNYGTEGRWCVIQDPAGAYAALFEPREAA